MEEWEGKVSRIVDVPIGEARREIAGPELKRLIAFPGLATARGGVGGADGRSPRREYTLQRHGSQRGKRAERSGMGGNGLCGSV